METILNNHEAVGAFIARMFLGLLLFFQGYDAVFNVKIKNIIATYQNSFSGNGIPKVLTTFGAWFTSYSELVCGVLITIGLFEYAALYLAGFNLIIVSIAFGINTPMWDTRHVFPRLILLIFLLSIPSGWNIFSIDYFFINQ